MKAYCPYCSEEQEYELRRQEVERFKGAEVNTYENIAVCKKCKHDLYVVKVENENNKRINEAYRKVKNVIQPEEIINLRKKYNLSQRELTKIIGLGKMTINRYENGAIPSKTVSDYFKLLIKNGGELKKIAKEAYENNLITKRTYEKVFTNYEQEKNNKDAKDIDLQEIYRKYIEGGLKRNPDIYNGYTTFELEKVENIISYIASKVKNLTITSLNKYLWYIDCISFNKRGVSITGITYQKQKYGPTITNRLYEELSALNSKYKRNDYDEESGTKTSIESKMNYDLSEISDDEKNIIDQVIKKLKNKKVTEISEMSHKENAWKKSKMLENISFEEAIGIKL